MEEKVKELIRESLYKHIKGIGKIDNVYDNDVLVNNWLTDIMALGFNHQNVETAVQDIYELQAPMMECGLIPVRSIEEMRARVFLSWNRFSTESVAFERYVELRDTESEDAVLFAVNEELEMVDEGDFQSLI